MAAAPMRPAPILLLFRWFAVSVLTHTGEQLHSAARARVTAHPLLTLFALSAATASQAGCTCLAIRAFDRAIFDYLFAPLD